jgi:peptidoglycan/LPS O-acetylase OafA/YrhL
MPVSFPGLFGTATSEAPADAEPALSLAGHLPALDGLRGLAIAMVIAHHFISFKHTPGMLAGVLGAFAASLWCGVDLFFVLSGFLVTRVLLAARGRQRYFRNFYIRRALRVFPLYYSVLAVLLVLALLGKSPASLGVPSRPATFLPLLLYYTNFCTLGPTWARFGPLFVFWSLAVEEHFYLAWPFIVRYFAVHWLPCVCLGVVAAAVGCRAALALLHAPNIAIYTLTFCRMDDMALGAGLGVALAGPRGTQFWSRVSTVAIAAAAAALLTVWIATGRHELSNVNGLVQQVGYPAIALLMGGLLVRAVVGPPTCAFVRFCKTNLMRTLGRYSYGMYVFHTMILAWVLAHFAAGPHAGWMTFLLDGVARPVIGTGMTFGVAWLSYHVLEKRMLALKGVLAPSPSEKRGQ